MGDFCGVLLLWLNMVKMGISGEARKLVSEVLVRNKNERNIERVIVRKLR